MSKAKANGQLHPDPHNARLHNDRNKALIRQSLQEVGGFRSIAVDGNDIIRAGNGVYEQAKELGMTVRVIEAAPNELIAVKRADLKGKKAERAALLDNRSGELSEWDDAVIAEIAQNERELLDGMFSDKELRELLGNEAMNGDAPDAQIDKAAELQAKWGVNRGDIWQIGRHRLMCGDSTSKEDVARLMDGKEAALMVTDPPYGVEYDPGWRNEAAEKGLISFAARREGKVANDDRIDWSDAYRLFSGNVVYCWHADRHASKVQQSLEAAGFEIRCQVIWAKSNFAISRGHYHWKHEPCWYAVREGKQAHWIGDHSQTTLWEINWDKNVDGGHGTQKPLECMMRPIRNHEGDVYDPFTGSGTTLVACEQTGRIGYGMEIEPKYCAVTLERLAAMGLTPERVTVLQA